MKDLSEHPGGTEQVKPGQTRGRAPAQPKAEQAEGNQDQETKSVTPRRRSPASTQAPANQPQDGGNTPATQPNRPYANQPQDGGNTPATQPNRPYTNQSTRPGTSPRPGGQGPRPAGQGGPQSRGGMGQRGPGGGMGQRSGPPPAPRGDRNTPGNTYTTTPGGYRGGPGQRGPGGGPAPRQPGSGPGQRTNGAGSNGHAPAQRSTQRGPGGPGRPGPGGPGQRGPGRPGGSGRPGGGRPGGRPASRSNSSRSQERRTAQVKEKATGPVAIPPQIIVKDLAELLQTSPIEIIRQLIKNNIYASINQVVDYEQAAAVAKELDFEPSPLAATSSPSAVQGQPDNTAPESEDAQAIEIPPVVTIMGHVDHGKTSLLDTIRKTKVAAGEAGGITQHIGAYQVEVNHKKITFLDTPGHEAFTAMRARGAQVAHIAIIVIAADDGIMPQTREAIDHAQAAKMPLIIALNKVDKPTANPDRVKQQLTEIGILIEEYGGDTICVPVSAKQGAGIDELLDYILLVAEVQDIKANPNKSAIGVIIEAKMERNTGPTATVLVQHGTLKMGDNIVVGSLAGKIRAMTNDRGKRIQKAPPSTPVSILGLPDVPQAGDRLEATPDERTAKQRATQEAEKRKNEAEPLGRVSLDTLYMQMQEGKVKELNVVLKSDVQGSSEAIKGALSKLSEENLKVRLIRDGIGNISEADIHLAAASGAIIIGFNVKADGAALREAQKAAVDIRYYAVIYKLTEDIQAALQGMLEPTYREVINGHAEILQTFKAGKNVIAGCRITDGRIVRSSQVRLLRKSEKVFEGKIASLRRGKDDVREVLNGYECGILLEDFNAYEVGDIIEAFAQERVQPGS